MVGSTLGKDEANSAFWLATRAERLAHLAYSGLPALIQSKQKNCVEQTYKNHIVFENVAKVAWDSEKRININEFSEFTVAPWNRKILKTQCEMNFPALQNWQIILDSDWNEIF